MSLVALEFIILQSCSLGEMGGGQPLCSYGSHWPQAVGNGEEHKSVMCSTCSLHLNRSQLSNF